MAPSRHVMTSCSAQGLPACNRVFTAVPATRAACRRTRRATKVLALRGALLDRQDEQAEEVQATSYEMLNDRDWSKEFQEYARATMQLDELESLREELLGSVATMDNLLLQPKVSVGQDASAEARRAKRQQARAARKAGDASATPAATAAPAQAQAVLSSPQTQLASTPAKAAAPARTRAAPRAAVVAAPSTASITLQPPSPPLALTPTSEVAELAGTALQLPTPSTSAAALSTGPSLLTPATGGARSKASVRASRNAVKRTATLPTGLTGALGAKTGGDGTSTFLQNAGNVSLLSPEEQKVLATKVKEFLGYKKMEDELKTILKRPPTLHELSKALRIEPMELRARMNAGQAAKAHMLKANYRLVVSIVKKYQNKGLSMQDLITEGMQGLLRGVEKFEVDKGFRFSTYAHWWIRQSVTRALQEQLSAVRLPTHMQEQLSKIKTARLRLSEELGRPPSLSEISEATGISSERIPEILAMVNQTTSLEQSAMDDDGASELKDMIVDTRDTPDKVFDDDMIKQNMEELLKGLPEREAGVLRMHWGLDGQAEVTLEEIGTKFNVTRERVRQLEARALQRLKQRKSELNNVMRELKDMPSVEVDSSTSRSSRGTNKSK